jgi:hypothetical protein
MEFALILSRKQILFLSSQNQTISSFYIQYKDAAWASFEANSKTLGFEKRDWFQWKQQRHLDSTRLCCTHEYEL